jgi:dihydrodipicolinate synthase/N-acetylneuraminate lyase
MKKLAGVVAAMVTPFDGADAPDLAAVRRLTDFLIAGGVNCLYPTGTTGEMFLLSVEERKAIVKTVIEQARGRVTVYVHAGALTLKDTLALARHAVESGADGIGVVTPAFFGVTEREMEAYYVEIAQSVPDTFPVYLYNIPQLSGNDLKAATIARIVNRCANVVGVKYSFPDMLRVNEYLAVKEGFSVLVGADRLLVPALAMGCDGTVSGVACVCPEPFAAIYKAVRAGEAAKALELQHAATGICELLKNGSNMAVFKAALRARGIDTGHMRRPLMDLPDDEAAAIGAELEVRLSRLGIPMRGK